MTRPLCFFSGTAGAPNVARLLENVGRMLSATEDLHLVSANPPERIDLGGHYTIFGDDRESTFRGSVRGLRTYLREHNPRAVVQLTRPPVHGTVCGLATVLDDTPFVYRYSGDRFYEYRVARGTQRATAFLLGNVLNRIPVAFADKHVTLGPRGRDRLVARGVAEENVTVLPPSVNRTRFEDTSVADLDVPDSRNVALFVGRLSHLKGRKTLETIVPRVLDRRTDIQFVFVGSGRDTLNLSGKYADHVTTVGRVPPDEIPAYMRAADVLIHPSLTEGVPRVLLEALAAGTPVIARDVGDVASVTANVFETNREFVEMVADFESLPFDDISPFACETLATRYRSFFESL